MPFASLSPMRADDGMRPAGQGFPAAGRSRGDPVDLLDAASDRALRIMTRDLGYLF